MRFSRRLLLKAGLGGVALSLPMLGRSIAAPSAFPKRFVVMWTPNGTQVDNWRCSGSETQFTLSPILQPLAPHQQDLLVLDGLDAMSAFYGPGDAHDRATGACLTGTQLRRGSEGGWASGISIDQAIANHIGDGTRFRSLEFGVHVTGSSVLSRISYRGPGQPIPPENDPSAMFDRLFSAHWEDPAARAERIARRKSILDVTAARYDRLLPLLGAEDRQKLEAHLTAIREVERRLDTHSNTCARPDAPSRLDPMVTENVPQIGRVQMDLLVEALACDLTRVATVMWTNSASMMTFPWLRVHEPHHTLSHRSDGDDWGKDCLTKINRWFAEQFAYLIGRLKSVPEGDGTLLDNTLLLWVNEHSKSNRHSLEDLPFVAAGRAGGAIRPGRLLRFGESVPHNNLWVSCLNAFGVPANSFGDPRFCTGPLSGLS